MTTHKAICVLNMQGGFGGAEKRYISLFNHLINSRSDFVLIINRSLFDLMRRNGLLQSTANVIVVNQLRPKKKKSSSAVSASNGKGRKKRSKGHVWQWPGKVKCFLRNVIDWILLAVTFISVHHKYKFTALYGVWQGGIWTWPLCRLLGIPFIYSVNSNNKHFWHRSVNQFFNSQYWVMNHADKLDFLSTRLVTAYRHIGMNVPDEKITVTPNSFVDYRPYYAEHPKEPWVVFMARLVPLKNPMLMLEAIKVFQMKYPGMSQVRFYFMGGGMLMADMKKYIARHQLRKVIMDGIDMEPWLILRKSSVFVSIQQTENYPSQALLEAMAAENATVASDVGDTRQLVTEAEGILVQFDASTVAGAIYQLLANPEECHQKGHRARKKVMTNHTIQHFSAYFLSLFD
ncbi:glycosyltransferase [Marinilabiliaceae bacterium JC017]|nr:glycosyltransferase [Marinilabiliaceae bacterium JC017]